MNYIIVNEHNEWVATGNTEVETPKEAIKNWLEDNPQPHWTEFYIYELKDSNGTGTPKYTVVNPVE